MTEKEKNCRVALFLAMTEKEKDCRVALFLDDRKIERLLRRKLLAMTSEAIPLLVIANEVKQSKKIVI